MLESSLQICLIQTSICHVQTAGCKEMEETYTTNNLGYVPKEIFLVFV